MDVAYVINEIAAAGLILSLLIAAWVIPAIVIISIWGWIKK